MPRVVLLTLCAAALAVSACDSAPGLPAEVRRPAVTAFALTPAADSLAGSAATATVPLVLNVTLAGEGTIVVRALVRYAETDTLVAETRVEAAPGPLRIELPVVLPRGATGDYAVTLTTEGADGRSGDGASAVFRFRAASLGPPAVAGVTVPATVTRPASAGARATPLTISAGVTDPDGRANIAAVLLVDAAGRIVAQLFDEGRTGRAADDAMAGDGRYTVTLGVPFEFETGAVTLFVVAYDRAGTASAPVSLTFEVR